MSKKKKLILVSSFLFLILGIILFKMPIVDIIIFPNEYKKYDEAKKIEIEAFNLYKQIQFDGINFDEDLLRNVQQMKCLICI